MFTQVLERSLGYLFVISGEPSFDLEEFQENGKTEATSICSLEQELLVCACQGPMLDQILFVPALSHLTVARGPRIASKGGILSGSVDAMRPMRRRDGILEFSYLALCDSFVLTGPTLKSDGYL